MSIVICYYTKLQRTDSENIGRRIPMTQNPESITPSIWPNQSCQFIRTSTHSSHRFEVPILCPMKVNLKKWPRITKIYANRIGWFDPGVKFLRADTTSQEIKKEHHR